MPIAAAIVDPLNTIDESWTVVIRCIDDDTGEILCEYRTALPQEVIREGEQLSDFAKAVVLSFTKFVITLHTEMEKEEREKRTDDIISLLQEKLDKFYKVNSIFRHSISRTAH